MMVSQETGKLKTKLSDLDKNFTDFRKKIAQKTGKEELTALIQQAMKSLIPQGIAALGSDDPEEGSHRSIAEVESQHPRRRSSTIDQQHARLSRELVEEIGAKAEKSVDELRVYAKKCIAELQE